MAVTLWSAVVALIVVAVGWRSLSHRYSLPCPAWLGYGVDLPGVSVLFGTQRTLDRMDVRPGQRVLEIGPGPGRLLIPVARRVQPHGEAVGLDVQPAMIEQLRARAADTGVTNLIGIVGDAATMTPPGQFDTVYIALALGEIPNRKATLRRCLHVLKPGGQLSITEMVPDPHFVPQRTVRRLAESVGFRHKSTQGSRLSFTATFEKDWDRIRTSAEPAADAPSATLLEICWHIRTPHGRVVTCGIYRDAAPGLDVRAGLSGDDLLRSQRTPEMGTAREIAEQWKLSVLAKGAFTELTSIREP